jgi:hypothetical protein
MEDESGYPAQAAAAAGSSMRANGVRLGALGGLGATVVIDLIMAGYLLLRGSPADGGFAVIGDTAAGAFSLLGIHIGGGVPLGLVLHYLIGLAMGVVFGGAVSRIRALRLTSVRQAVGLGIGYTELASLPLLISPSIVLGWPAEPVSYFGFFLAMHAIWGTLLGLVVSRGMPSRTGARHG